MNKIYPFKFLDSYTRADKDLFFGRDEEIRILYEMVFQGDIIFVYGPSGSGKTSLIQCGLANEFETHDWLNLYVRRGSDLNVSLEQTLTDAAGGSTANVSEDLDWLDRLLESDVSVERAIKTRKPLNRRFRAIYHQHFKPIYLVFDQFEELFILGSDQEQATFIDTVAELLQVDVPVTMIFSMREEYLGHLFEFERRVPQLLRKKLRVEPMNLDKVRQVIGGINSLANSMVQIGEGEVDQFAETVFKKIRGKEKTLTIRLPYMQVFLDKLYLDVTGDQQRQSEAIFRMKDLEDMGDIEDVLRDFLEDQVKSIHRYLADRYGNEITEETVWKMLSPFASYEGTKEPISKERLSRQLDATAALPERYQASEAAVRRSMIDDAVESFIDNRILRYIEAGDLYEIVHDSLAKRIAEKRSDEEIAVLEIQRLIKNQSSLHASARELFTRKQLNFIEPFLQRLTLTDLEQALIDDSYREAERQEAEEQLRERRKRERRIKNIFFGIVSLFAVIAVGTAIFAIFQWHRATQAERLARENEAEALIQKTKAEESALIASQLREQAELNADEAVYQRGLAEQNAQEALRLKRLAELSEAEALRLKQQAELSESEARRQEALAKISELEALRQRAIAEDERKEAERLSKLVKAQNLAYKATQNYPNEQLNGLLALESYLLNMRNDDGLNPRDPGIYEGMRSAIVKLSEKDNIAFRMQSDAVGCAFNSDGQLEVLNSKGWHVQYNLQTRTRNPKQKFQYDYPINKAFLFLMQDMAVMSYENRQSMIWQVSGERWSGKLLEGLTHRLRAVAISPDARHMATGGRDQMIKIWDLHNLDAPINIVDLGSNVRSLIYTTDGKFLVSGDERGRLILWNVEQASAMKIDLEEQARKVNISSDIIRQGDLIAVGYSDGLIKIINVQSLAVTEVNSVNIAGIDHIAINNSEQLMAVASADATIKVYRLNRLFERPITLSDHRQKVDGILFDPEDRVVALCRDHTIRVWETDLQRMSEHLCALLQEPISMEDWISEVADTSEMPYDPIWKGIEDCRMAVGIQRTAAW